MTRLVRFTFKTELHCSKCYLYEAVILFELQYTIYPIQFHYIAVMDTKYGTMLQNIAIRHVFYRLPSKDEDIKNQLMGLTKVHIYNYFILGSFETIEKVLKIGSMANMNTNKYAWYAMTKDNNPKIKCGNCKDNMKVVYMFPMAAENSNTGGKVSIEDIRKKFGLEIGSDVDVAFYFDVGLSALKAAR